MYNKYAIFAIKPNVSLDMKLQTSFFLGLLFLFIVSCKTQYSVPANEFAVTNRLVILLEEAITPKAFIKNFPELTIVSRTNRTLNEWLFEYTASVNKRSELLKRIEQSPHVQSVDITK